MFGRAIREITTYLRTVVAQELAARAEDPSSDLQSVINGAHEDFERALDAQHPGGPSLLGAAGLLELAKRLSEPSPEQLVGLAELLATGSPHQLIAEGHRYMERYTRHFVMTEPANDGNPE